MKRIIYILLVLAISVLSCKDDDNNPVIPQETFGTVALDFKNTINNSGIELGTDSYTNQSNEEYIITELKYIISNIVLIKANGEAFVYPVDRSYFVINEEVVASQKINLADISAGEYTKIRFGFGVEASKYPFESGMADFIPTAEDNGMLWSWSAGYKFLKFEGTFTFETKVDEDFIIHVGSHGATLDNYQEITLELPSPLTIAESSTPEIAINVDIAKVFDSINIHSLNKASNVQVDPENAPKIAKNVSTMFNVTGVTN